METYLRTLRIENEMLQEKIKQLEQALMPDNVIIKPEWQLTAMESRIFSTLANRNIASKDAIMTALYASQPKDAPEIHVVSVFISKLRAKLRPFGIRINTVWGIGFRLEERETFLVANREAAQ